jgi:uncharacterized membrane protein
MSRRCGMHGLGWGSAAKRLGRRFRPVIWVLVVSAAISGAAQGQTATIAPLLPLYEGMDGIPRSWPYAISADGSTIVGAATNQYPWANEACRWQRAGGRPLGLGDLPGASPYHPDPYSTAYGITSDGSAIVGSVDGVQGIQAAIWWGSGPYPLGVLPGGDFYSEAKAVSDNWRVVGVSSSGSGN